jgi:hypothetical protein
MTVFSNFHLFVTGVFSPRASVLPARRGTERRSNHFAAAVRVAAAAGEIGLFLWMALAVAVWLLMMAGFFA